MNTEGLQKTGILIKFGSNENIRKLQNGQVYMKNMQYYIDLEKATDDENVGDMYEGQLMFGESTLVMTDEKTGDRIGEFDCNVESLSFGYLKMPIYCMFLLDQRNISLLETEKDDETVRYKFSEKQKEELKYFGDSALIILNPTEFWSLIVEQLGIQGIAKQGDKVSYYSGKSSTHFKEVAGNPSRVAFWKRDKYAYQQEYRLLLKQEIEDAKILEIGDISHITQIVPTSDLLNGGVKLMI